MARFKIKSPDATVHERVRALLDTGPSPALENRKRRTFAVEDPAPEVRKAILEVGADLVSDEAYDLDREDGGT